MLDTRTNQHLADYDFSFCFHTEEKVWGHYTYHNPSIVHILFIPTLLYIVQNIIVEKLKRQIIIERILKYYCLFI